MESRPLLPRAQAILAAINRFRRVIENYQTTTHVPEALERLTECYLALGIKDEAQNAAAVLGYNYPGSDWYQDSYNLLTNREPAADEEGRLLAQRGVLMPVLSGDAAEPVDPRRRPHRPPGSGDQSRPRPC
jgi:hypothetical protein